MNSQERVLVVGFFLVAMAATAGAQMGMRGGTPQFHGVWSPVVGQGAAYEMQTKSGLNTSMEIAVVGKESVGGKDGYWFEMAMSNPRMPGQMVTKSLTVLDGGSVTVSRVIVQMPGGPPMEMPAQMPQMQHQNQSGDVRKEADDLGSESVTTPAGTFACEHYRLKDGSGDSWVSKTASPYGLVKFQGKDSTMVVTKLLTDVKDKITGTPQPFNPMMMMGQPPARPQQ
jgi:hypothetical protein